MGFLREEYRKNCIETLIKLGTPSEMAERVTNIPEGKHDQHRWAHAQVCAHNAVGEEDHNLLHLMLSATVLEAIQKEAEARKMGVSDFPISEAFVHRVITDRQSQRENTRH